MNVDDNGLVLSESELDSMLTGAEWPRDLAEHELLRIAFTAISEPAAMGAATVIAVGERRIHTFWAAGVFVAFLIDLGRPDGTEERQFRLTSMPMDRFPLLLMDATGTTEVPNGDAGQVRPFTEEDFAELFGPDAPARDCLTTRGWERVWRVTAAPASNPDDPFQAVGLIVKRGEEEQGFTLKRSEVDDESLVAVPTGAADVYYEFCELAALLDVATG